jgi:hypothetical protein
LKLLSVLALVAAMAAVLPGTAFAAPPQSGPLHAHYVIFTTNRVPILNIGEVGTLTLDLTGTPNSFTFDWSFRGSTDGSPASASGTGSGSGNGNELTLNLDTISSWDMPGFAQPETGKTAFIRRLRGNIMGSVYFLTLNDFPNFPHAIVAGVPLIVSPRFNGPFAHHGLFGREGGGFFFEASAGTGSTDISTLPGSPTRTRGPARFPLVQPFGI